MPITPNPPASENTQSQPKIPGIKYCVFDAYGTLFDVNAAAARMKDVLGDKEQKLSEVWRMKQLQYTWLRTLMTRAYVDMWQVTQDSLDYALEAVEIEDQAIREQLLELYWVLDAYPEVTPVLRALKEGGMRTAILSNGSPAMLEGAVQSAGIEPLLDAVLSIDELQQYKPRPEAYELVTKHFDSQPKDVCFMSSNAWDAAAAAHFGFHVCWVNRFNQPREKLPGNPTQISSDLTSVPNLVGAV